MNGGNGRGAEGRGGVCGRRTGEGKKKGGMGWAGEGWEGGMRWRLVAEGVGCEGKAKVGMEEWG